MDKMEHGGRGWWLLYGLGALIALFLVLPAIIVIPISFSDSSCSNFLPRGSLYAGMRPFSAPPAWTKAMALSFKLGLGTMVVSTVLGVMAAIGLVRGNFPGKGLLYGFLLSPHDRSLRHHGPRHVLFLQLIENGGTSFFPDAEPHLPRHPDCHRYRLRLPSGFRPQPGAGRPNHGGQAPEDLLQGHVSHHTAGVVTGALFAFIISFDEVVIAAFIGGYRSATLPKRMFDNVRDEMDPTIAAIATLLVL